MKSGIKRCPRSKKIHTKRFVNRLNTRHSRSPKNELTCKTVRLFQEKALQLKIDTLQETIRKERYDHASALSRYMRMHMVSPMSTSLDSWSSSVASLFLFD